MIKDMIKDLVELPEGVWDEYALQKEPLKGKITKELKEKLLYNTHLCGKSLAEEVKSEYGNTIPSVLAEKLGLEVFYVQVEDDGATDGGNYNMFACYYEPNQVKIFNKTVKDATELIKNFELDEILGEVQILEILMAHEIYHYFEYTRKDLYTNQKLLTLWKLGKYKNVSKLVSLNEIGAMEFTKDLLGLPYSPYIFDVLLLYTMNKRLSYHLYESILQLNQIA